MGEHICIIIDSGWILEGVVTHRSRSGGIIHMEDASVVRSWDNGRGIGAIAKPEHKDEYVLDPIGNVNVYESRALFEIPMDW